MRLRPIRPHACPIVGEYYFTDIVLDTPKKTYRCVVLAVDHSIHMALVAWTDDSGLPPQPGWIDCDELRKSA